MKKKSIYIYYKQGTWSLFVERIQKALLYVLSYKDAQWKQLVYPWHTVCCCKSMTPTEYTKHKNCWSMVYFGGGCRGRAGASGWLKIQSDIRFCSGLDGTLGLKNWIYFIFTFHAFSISEPCMCKHMAKNLMHAEKSQKWVNILLPSVCTHHYWSTTTTEHWEILIPNCFKQKCWKRYQSFGIPCSTNKRKNSPWGPSQTNITLSFLTVDWRWLTTE